MTIAQKEYSTDDSYPIELFKFSFRGEAWRYTTAEWDLVHNGEYYQRYSLKRSNLSVTGVATDDTLDIEVPLENPIIQLFVSGLPVVDVELVYSRIQRSDCAYNSLTGNVEHNGRETQVAWIGRVRAASVEKFNGKFTVDLAGSSLLRACPRRLYTRMCSHMLYDSNCTLNQGSHVTETNVSLIEESGTVVHVGADLVTGFGGDGNTDNFFGGGMIGYATGDLRRIKRNEANKLYLDYPFETLKVGDAVKVYEGCNHKVETCRLRFNNIENFGGFPLIPSINPFETEL